MKTKNIRQTATFSAEPNEIYELIMDSKKHSAFTGSKAVMSKKVNGKFETYDGYIHGYNIQIEPGCKIVQAWHFAEDGWPDDHYSICTFIFEKTALGTKLLFTQSDVPEHSVKNLTSGWKEFYWEPMKAFLKSNRAS